MSAIAETELPGNPWWLRRPNLLTTGALAVSVFAALIEVVRIVIAGGGVVPLAGVLITLSGAIIACWKGWLGLAVALVGCAITPVTGWNPITEWTIVVFTLFAVTLRGALPLRSTVFVAVPLYAIVALEADSGLLSADVLAAVAATVAGGAAGAAIRSQQRYWSALRAHAREAIVTRETEARRRVEQERLRIARDLHDVVGHQVAVASMHLGAVEVTVHTAPSEAMKAAADARAALRTVTSETQQILELLRAQDAEPSASRTVAGVASIGALIDSFIGIGLRVAATLPEVWPTVHPGTNVTVYRVVQEALTNAHRHGSGSAAVTIAVTDHRIEVSVTNPIPDVPMTKPGSGFGLIGMRERVNAAGGRLIVDDTASTEFSVSAVLAVDGRKLS